ncbi:MAG TPA: TSUP family transporter [Candidatus Binatia bacterium]|nr:TSUP family transporter [Candidatus Binatia bacterium]
MVDSVAIPFWQYPLLLLTGLAGGFVDSIAGGGGLITIPVLLNLGMAPQVALGTNKLQATFGSASATWHYRRAGLIDFHSCRLGIGFTLLGAVMGALLVSHLPAELLRQAIPWLLIAIALYFLFQPRLGIAEARPRLNADLFHGIFGLGIGFYDGFFGPGTGTFWAMAYMVGLGLNLTRATAHTKLMNFASNVASLVAFVCGGQILFGAGLCMGLGQVLGARLGSKMVIQKGAKWIRPIFVSVVLAITLRLLWQNFAKALT